MARHKHTGPLALILAAGAAVGLQGEHAHAAILSWNSAVNGAASLASNWNPAQVPVGADTLVFNATAGVQSYTVTFSAATGASAAMTFNQDSVTLSLSSAHTTSGAVGIGVGSTDVASVTLGSGTWTIGGQVTLGTNSGSSGTLGVNSSASDILLTSPTADLVVGSSGAGTLNITNGGLVQCADQFIFGSNATSTASATISGATSSLPLARSTLKSTGINESRFGQGGDATISILNGALVDIDGNLVVANGSASTSSVTVQGAGGILPQNATLQVDGTLRIGGNSSVGIAAGIGTVTVNSGGVVSAGTLEVGNDPDGGTGTLNINTGGLVLATNVVDGAGGTILHTGGTLRINGGAYTGHADPLVISGTGSPSLHLTGGLTKTLSPAGTTALIVGDNPGAGTHTGSLLIDGGAQLIINGISRELRVGDDAGTTGTVTVSGAGSSLVCNSLNSLVRLGVSGDGELNVLDGGSCAFRTLVVQGANTSSVNVNVSGNSSTLGTQTLTIGTGSGSGIATVNVQQHGTLHVTGTGLSTNILGTGTLSIASGSTFDTAGTVTVHPDSELLVGGELLNAALVDVSGVLTSNSSPATPLVDAPVRVRSGGELRVITNNLTMGDATAAEAVIFDSGSTIIVGSGRTLTLLNNTLEAISSRGAINMQGGTIVSGSVLLMDGTAADQLGGFGTIDADIRTNSLGLCTPTGSGLVFQRTVHMNGSLDASGTLMRFASGSDLVDLGTDHTLNCKVVFDAGSVIRPNVNTSGFANVTMGDGSLDGVTMNGVLHMGTNGSLTLNDLNGVALGTLTDMNGGTITCLNGLSVQAGRVIRGKGTLNVSNPGGNGFTVNGGTIDPDDYFSVTNQYRGIGTFFVNGRYSQQATGTYLCEIAGFNNEFQPLNDRVSCGQAVLNGTLQVSLIDGYEPGLCDEFTIMTYTSRSGSWSNIVQPPGVSVGVRYEATRAVLFFNSVRCDSIDFNNDGLFPDTQDIDDFLAVFGGSACPSGNCNDLDFNNDCLFPDTGDIDSLLSVFSGGPCP